jgi:hypothetical protein
MRSQDVAQYRVRDGILELRPTAWVEVSGAERVGSDLTITCHYSDEAPEQHQVSIDGEVYDCDRDAAVIFTPDEAREYVIRPVSAPHYCLVTAIPVMEDTNA